MARGTVMFSSSPPLPPPPPRPPPRGSPRFFVVCPFAVVHAVVPLSSQGDGEDRSVLVFRMAVSSYDLWGKKNMRVKGTTHINRRTINSFWPAYISCLPAEATFR